MENVIPHLDIQTTKLQDYVDGVLGLGLNNVGTNSKPFIRSIIDQGIIGTKVFSIWLNPEYHSSGYITYGDIDARCELLNDDRPFYFSSYVFSVHSLEMFHFIGAYLKAEIDLDEVLSMPPAIAGMIARRVGAQFDPGSNRYWIDCNARFPDLMLDADLPGKTKTIPAAQLILNDFEPRNMCVLAVVGRDQPSFGPTLTLGVPFLHSYCAIFNIDEMRMQFAKNLDNRQFTTVSSETATSTSRPATFSSKPVTSVYPPITLSTEATATDASTCKMFILSSLCVLLLNSF
ncbi:unnamed protein product [Cylicocyclus nassatus]|uniref:Peptidase A1 domain-containing protein n=1 Tax=Cylicocyclus nassatus TaxID=53992 RepID=A0AA36H101_CYLNA|nr:unnamed protein product [Cylicocyclus nassatus]